MRAFPSAFLTPQQFEDALAYTVTLLLLAAAYRQRVLSDHWSNKTRSGTDAREHVAGAARQAAQTATSRQDAALIAELLSLPNDGRFSTLELTPEQRRQRTLEALISQVQALTRSRPVLMIVEDAYWTDPSSLEVFGRIVDRVARMVSTFKGADLKLKK
jgi:predicted ATPase